MDQQLPVGDRAPGTVEKVAGGGRQPADGVDALLEGTAEPVVDRAHQWSQQARRRLAAGADTPHQCLRHPHTHTHTRPFTSPRQSRKQVTTINLAVDNISRYRRHAMLARVAYHPRPCVCLSVCLSQVGVLSKRLNESSCFWHGNFFYPSYTVLTGNSAK